MRKTRASRWAGGPPPCRATTPWCGRNSASSSTNPSTCCLAGAPTRFFASYWPYAEGDIAKPFNRATKYVATRKGVDLTWKGSVALRDAAKDVAKLKQEDGPPLITQGSAELVHSLLAAGLVDELRTFTFPVLLGKGKRLFSDDSKPRAFKLTQSVVSPNGIIHATYV